MVKIIKQFIEYLRGIFNNSATTEIVEEEVNNTDCANRLQCSHQFTRWQFVKGGGRSRVCKICGYEEHKD